MLRAFIPLWIAFIAASLINGFTIRALDSGLDVAGNVISGITMFMYMGLMIGINVVGLVLLIQRFYNGLLRDEGYLMFTLPVKPRDHVLSKGIVSTVIIIVNATISVGSVVILAGVKEISELIGAAYEHLLLRGLNPGAVISLSLLLLLVTVIANVYQIYASMAIGHLFNSRRVAFSVGAYLAISVASSTIGSIIPYVFSRTEAFSPFMNSIMGLLYGAGYVDSLWSIYGVFIAAALLQLVAFFITTERILTKKLNLE